jgi:D-glycero-D-manno-heptose 1,7-bisphosphate phosphatase
MDRAVFVDRDGTINVEKEFLYRPEEFQFIPGAPEALMLLNEAGFRVIVVTNQSGIARGYYDEAAVERLHRHVDRELSRFGARVDAYYFCPHHPEQGIGEYLRKCDCRKPMDGMLRRGAAELSVDIKASYMIGDRLADVEAGVRAGCKAIMIKTGYGATESAMLPVGIPVYDSLPDAVRAIIDGDV